MDIMMAFSVCMFICMHFSSLLGVVDEWVLVVEVVMDEDGASFLDVAFFLPRIFRFFLLR